MNTATSATTLAGCAIAIAILGLQLRKWWTGGRALKDLIPTVQGFITGALGTACAGGLAGWLAGCTRQVASGGGAKIITGTTGTEASAPIASGSIGTLTSEGGVIVFFVMLILVATYKAAPKDEKGKLLGALAAGFILCTTAGVAGMLTGLPDLANSLGTSAGNILAGTL